MPVILPLLVALASAAPPQPGASQVAPPPRSRTSGLAFTLEVGPAVRGHGVGLIYYHPMRARPVTFSAHLAVGFPGAFSRAPLPAADLGASFGFRHRGLLTLGWGPIRRSQLSLHGTMVAVRTLFGAELGGAYEYVSDGGMVFRALVGLQYLPASWQEPGKRIGPTAGLTVGRKLW